jgi:hypothetical protein
VATPAKTGVIEPGDDMAMVARVAPSRYSSRAPTSLAGRLFLVVVISMAGLVSACGSGLSGEVEYQPVFLPVTFTYNGSSIDVKGEREIVTFIGTFSIGAKYTLPENDADAIYVIIRNRKEKPSGFDHTYKVKSGRGDFSAVVNGRTLIQVVDRQVLIDVTDGRVEEIQLKNVEPVAATGSGGSLSDYGRKWDEYWSWAVYKPFSLFAWVYDDSTISQGHGLGFVWFLIRLVLALFALVVDLVLTAVFVIGGFAHVLFGVAARNVVLGLFALMGIGVVVLGVAVFRY